MTSTRRFSPAPGSVSAARRFVAEAIGAVDAEVREAVALMVSELTTNCIRHTGSGFAVSVVHAREEIRVEVTDRAPGEPRMRSPTPDEPTGRGLQIVNLLASTWGVERAAGAKTVWFTVPVAG